MPSTRIANRQRRRTTRPLLAFVKNSGIDIKPKGAKRHPVSKISSNSVIPCGQTAHKEKYKMAAPSWTAKTITINWDLFRSIVRSMKYRATSHKNGEVFLRGENTLSFFPVLKTKKRKR